jgi:hypothetical protein
MSSLLQRFTENPKKLFLIDATGALISIFFLGFVLRIFESAFGMPSHALLLLAVMPVFFAAYDYYCYFFLKGNWRPYLNGIAFANLAYCCVTIHHMIFYYENLTNLGLGYFLVELLIILILVVIELKVTRIPI